MSSLERFGVSMDEDLLSKFDSMIKQRGYQSRSEAIRDLIRKEIVQNEWDTPDSEVVGTITIVYEHHRHELSHTLTELQHQYHQSIVCSSHVHLDQNNCLEVIIIRGSSKDVKHLSDSLLSSKGVKHGELVCSTTGRFLE